MNNIAAYRVSLGITQAKLGSVLGWRQSRIANYETGRRTPGIQDCYAIVEALNNLGSDCSMGSVFPPGKSSAMKGA